MEAKEAAAGFFSRIGCGHRNAISRPDTSTCAGANIDRELRNMIERANNNGDCIINIGSGYFRPIPGDKTDELALKEYIKKEVSRASKVAHKAKVMKVTFENWRKESWTAEKKANEEKESLQKS